MNRNHQDLSLGETIAVAKKDYFDKAFDNKYSALKKEFLKTMRYRQNYPLRMQVSWTHPTSKNNWIISLRAYNKSQKKTGNLRLAIGFTFRRKEGRYLLMPITANGTQGTWALMPPHFFKRYRQRILKEKDTTTLSVIETYLERNPALAASPTGSTFPGITDYSKEKTFFAKIPDGTVFGTYETLSQKTSVLIVKTIVRDDMLFENQHDEQDWLKEEVEFIMNKKTTAKK